MSFNIFGPATKKDIRVGYIDPDLGYVQNISILEANKYAALNPGTMFILKNRDATKYLTLNEVNALTPDVLDVDNNVCGGIQGLRPGERAPFSPLSGTGSGGTQTGSNVNVSYDNGCRGRLFLTGGGGVGAVGSPIFGRDGSLLAIRVVSGGFGYKYPPKAKLVDSCRRGSGAVIRTIIGELPPTTEYFDQEEDFEVYDLTPDGTELSGYGLRYGVEGEVLGNWDPNLFATLAADPIQGEIQKYQDFLRQGINPFWHTRKENPISVTFRDKTTRVLHNVTDKGYRKRRERAGIKDDFGWSDWMNKYAVAPIPESNAPGSDYAGQVATMEWEENFPYTGEYVFRGMADNVGKLYLDNELIINTGKFGGLNARNIKPSDTVKKTIQEGVHRIKVDLLNIPIKEKVKPVIKNLEIVPAQFKEKVKPVIKNPEIVPVQFEVYGQGSNSNMKISFVFNSKDHSFTVPNVKKSKGTYKKTINVKPNVDYKVTSILTGSKTHTSKTVDNKRELNIKYDGLNKANNPIDVSAKKLKLKDGHGDDTNAMFTISSASPGLNVRFSDDGKKLVVKGDVGGDVTLKLNWDDNPRTAGVAVKSIKILGETWRQKGTRGEETKTIKLGKPVKEIEKSARALEQGLSKIFGRGEKGTERGEGEGKIVFADYIGSVNDNDDMQIQCGSGSFTSSNKKSQTGTGGQGTKTRNTYDLSFRINAKAGSQTQNSSTQTQNSSTQTQNSSTQTQTTGSIFTTTHYIRKADRKLWRTNVYGRGGFLNEYGVCPFNTRKSLDDNPYAGRHVIRWENIDFPADGNYNITVDVDDFAKIFIGNRAGGGAIGIGNGLGDIEQGGDEVIIENGMKKTTHTKFFKKGKYRIRAELNQIPGGRFSFDGDGKPKSNRITARFVNRDGKKYLKVDGSGTAEISFKLRVDDNPRVSGVFASKVKIGLPPNDYVLLSRSRSSNGYKERETITGSDVFEAGREYLVDTIGSSSGTGSIIQNNGNSIGYDDDIDIRGFDKNGELSITKIKNLQSSSVKGANPMALAIKIDVGEIEQTRIAPKSFNENPMGGAFTIDAPLPPIPESPIPVGEGRCPKNPIWTTRFPGGQKKWWPVNHPAWSKFTNRFALSPLPPLSSLNSDGGGGITYENTWPLEIPYDGFYGIKGTADNAGRILIDGREVYKFKGFKNTSPKIEKVKLIAGKHEVKVEVVNFRQENTKIIKKKIFNTQDWAKKLSAGGSVDVNFKITSDAQFANTVEMKEVFSFGKSYDGPQINKTTSKTLESGKVYDVIFNSNRKGGGGNKGYQINYEGLNSANDTIDSSSKELKFKDGDGNDANAEFKIVSSSPGLDVKFSGDGRSLDVKGSGDVTIRLKWSDNPSTAGVALKSISLGGKTWRQSGSRGDQTETIKVSGGSSSSQGNNSAIKLRNAGESVVQMEDYKDNDWQDIVVSASKGKFYDFKGNKCKYVVGGGTKAVQVSPTQNGVTYSGPDVFRYIDTRKNVWSDFMNKNNVSPFIPPLTTDNPNIVGLRTFTWSNVDFPENGSYELEFQSDDVATLFINGQEVAVSRSFNGTPSKRLVNLSRGKYELKVTLTNAQLPKDIFANYNPTGFALKIIKDVKKVVSTPPWTTNPLCASAIIIPPPCPKVIEGTGVVTDIIAEEPGNGYPTPPGGGPPVTLVLKEVIPTSPGINYGPDDLVLIDGKPLKPILGPFGTVEGVEPSDRPYYGITEYPNITMPSDTGVGFRGRPVFEPVIVPELVLPEDQLLQVTDLVGLKQTGYVNGRPYYGSTFSQEGILYAGVYETTGDLVQVYATLQESVDGQVTTRASAILRQGSDVTSNDPRLNIPNTPDNLI
jgi:hypothetical protein